MLKVGNVLRKPSNALRSLLFFSQRNKAIRDTELLEALRSEISSELTSEPSKNDKSGSVGDFVIEWDSSKSQDVFLRKKSKSGEEVAVSALIGGQTFEAGSGFPVATDVQMKVCIKKPGLSDILQFDCKVSHCGEEMPRFDIQSAYCIQSASSMSSSQYRGPLFSHMDPQLQDELRKYLQARGIGKRLLNSLISHLQQKEQRQYVNWLQKLESSIGE